MIAAGMENLIRRVLERKLDLVTRLDIVETVPGWNRVLRDYRSYLESFCDAEVPARIGQRSRRSTRARGFDGLSPVACALRGGASSLLSLSQSGNRRGGVGEDPPRGVVPKGSPGTRPGPVTSRCERTQDMK